MNIFHKSVWLSLVSKPIQNRTLLNNYGILEYSTKSTTKPLQSSSEYCLEMVRKYDHENFLCTLLLPSQIRTSAFAIRAFNIEVARIKDNVSDMKIGQMRMKFWEDTIENLYKNNIPKHPVALELNRALQKHKLSKRYFKRLVALRTTQLTTSTLPTLETMESYAENCVSSIFYLLLEASGVTDVNTDHVASHLGKSQGIVNFIRSIPYNAQRNVVALPQDILLKYQVADESVLRGNRDQPLRDAVFDVANRAKQHLDKARNLSSTVPKEVKLLFLPAVTIDSYLERLRRVDFDAFDSGLQKRNSFLPFVLYWNKIKSEY